MESFISVKNSKHSPKSTNLKDKYKCVVAIFGHLKDYFRTIVVMNGKRRIFLTVTFQQMSADFQIQSRHFKFTP